MNLFENAKATARLAGGESCLSLADGRCKGKFTLKEGKTTVSSAITEKKCGRLTAAYVKASVKGGCFDADTAVSFIIPSLGDIEGYMANFQSCPHWCRPVSYTHLDVYKRQMPETVYTELFWRERRQ